MEENANEFVNYVVVERFSPRGKLGFFHVFMQFLEISWDSGI
jgi:hypothetical protein